MSADDIIKKVYAAYKNVGPSKVPSKSDDKYQLALGRIDDAVKRWASYPGIHWRSLQKDFSVTTSNGVASLPFDFLELTGNVRINGELVQVVPQDEKIYHTKGAYLYGKTPAKIALIDKSNPVVTITGEYRRSPAPVTQPNSQVECESHAWLWLYVAGQMASGDPAKEETAPELYQQADVEWQSLIARYNQRIKGSPRNIPPSKRSGVVSKMGRTW